MKQNMSSPSPVTDGRHVWALTGTGMLAAFDFAGKEIWKRDIQKDYGRFGIMHGYAASPLLHENALYVPVLHGMMTDDPSYLLKIDTASGKTIWRIERPTKARFVPRVPRSTAAVSGEGPIGSKNRPMINSMPMTITPIIAMRSCWRAGSLMARPVGLRMGFDESALGRRSAS